MAKAIREAYGKNLLARYLEELSSASDSSSGPVKEVCFPVRTATVTARTDYALLAKDNPWLEAEVSAES